MPDTEAYKRYYIFLFYIFTETKAKAMLLKQRRLERGLTQEELATPGITQATIANCEAGKQWASKATRRKIEAMIGPVDWVGTKLQSIEFTGAEDDGTGDIILAISAYVFDSNVVDPVEKCNFLQRAIEALKNSITVEPILT